MNCMDGLDAKMIDAEVPFHKADTPSVDLIFQRPSAITLTI
jgi:hypothetical protein